MSHYTRYTALAFKVLVGIIFVRWQSTGMQVTHLHCTVSHIRNVVIACRVESSIAVPQCKLPALTVSRDMLQQCTTTNLSPL